MPIDPSPTVLIASLEAGTLTLLCTLFVEGVGVLAGVICATIFAVTWKG